MAHLLVYHPSRDSVVADLRLFSEQVKTRTTTAICIEFTATHGAEVEHDRKANRTAGVIHLTDVNQVLAGMDEKDGGSSSGCSTFPTGFLSRRVPT